MKLIGVDVGGTFTDIVLTDTDSNTTAIHKVPSTPDDPSRAVIDGVRGICEREAVAPAAIDHVFHGTTVATNAVLQHRGVEAGMITNEGFRDVLHIGRHQRPQHYSIMQDIPWQRRPLVKRRFRRTVGGRLAPPRGEELVPLDEAGVRAAALELQAGGVRAIAVCFLFSYLNPAHEQRARDIIADACPGLFVTASHEVSPQFREFERFTTCAMNAFIGPLVRDYVNRLQGALQASGIRGELHIMGSNGGVATAQMVAERPVLTLMSGLAAGVMGGAWVGELAGRRNVITLDIGGTSADIGVITDGRYAEASARDTEVGGYPVMVPMIDLHTIGAGGGSIAHQDEGGAFRVGPISAGAVPGPAAYGRGGREPTVTDANLMLGRLDADNFLGGAMRLDHEGAHAVISALAGRLGLELAEAAEGVIALLNANMANAIRARTVQKGIDPREYALVASGGAGPLHGAEVAAALGIPEVIVPPSPGINSAMGLLTTDLKYDLVQTAFVLSTAMDYPRVNAALEAMQARLAAQLDADGVDPAGARFLRSADARYVGQGYELRVSLAEGRLDDAALAPSVEAFHALHEAEYGHCFRGTAVEFVNVRVSAVGPVARIGRPARPAGGTAEEALLKRARSVFRVDDALRDFDTAFYRREHLPLNTPVAGPAIVLQEDSTTVVPPRWALTVLDSGVMRLHREPAT